MVLQVDKERQTLVVSHDRIPGYMEPMAMPFRVRDPHSLEGLQPGMRVEFKLVVKSQESYIDRLRLKGGARYELDPEAPRPAASNQVALGQAVPDF